MHTRRAAFAITATLLGAALVGCSNDEEPTLSGPSVPQTVPDMVTRAPDSQTATTRLGPGPLDINSGVLVDASHPCARVAAPLVRAFGAGDEGASTPASAGCQIATRKGTLEVSVEPYSPAGRKAGFETYEFARDTAKMTYVEAKGVPILYYTGTAGQPGHELALFPDNAMVLYRLPAPIETSPELLSEIVSAFTADG
jgi:hypothetical protein